jgi:hypothetical protein
LRGRSDEDEPGDGFAILDPWPPGVEYELPGPGDRLSLVELARGSCSVGFDALAGARWEVERSRDGVRGVGGAGAGR